MPCPGCGKQHTIPYIPGTYRLCASREDYRDGSIAYLYNEVTITEDGEIEYESKYQ